MAFQTKDFISILASMVNRMRSTQSQITDFNVGGVARALLEAPAIELEAFYVELVNGLLDAIPAAVYQGFDFGRLPAAYAAGEVTFSRSVGGFGAHDVPAGTLVQIPNTDRLYAVTATVTMSDVQNTVAAKVLAVKPGSASNALPGTVTSMVAPVSGFGGVVNALAITSGRDQETDGERRDRFVLFLESLARGTQAALRHAALSCRLTDNAGAITEYVTRVGLEEDLPGRVNLWLYGSGGALSNTLLSLVQATIEGADGLPGYRAAGVQVTYNRMNLLPVNVTVALNPLPGWSVDTAMINGAIAAIGEYFASIEPGDYVRVSLLTAQLLRVTGVASVDLVVPTENILVPVYSMPVPGTLDIS